MDRIAVAAGVSKSTLYSYFQDKAGLFAALIQQIVQGDREIGALNNDKLLQIPLRDSLKCIATTMLEKVSGQQPVFILIRLIIGESGRFPVLAKTFVRNAEQPRLKELSYLFANHPDFKAADPEVAAICFYGSIVYYVILQEILHGRDIIPLERDRFIEGLINVTYPSQK
jgi:AcrR family transcriptional regulator